MKKRSYGNHENILRHVVWILLVQWIWGHLKIDLNMTVVFNPFDTGKCRDRFSRQIFHIQTEFDSLIPGKKIWKNLRETEPDTLQNVQEPWKNFPPLSVIRTRNHLVCFSPPPTCSLFPKPSFERFSFPYSLLFIPSPGRK